MIIPNANTLGEPSGPAPDLASLISGRFGLFWVEDAPECADLNAANSGYMKITPDTKNNPQSGPMAYGNVQTWNSQGAGTDGRRAIPPVGGAKEWIIQILFMADGSLYTRARVNDNPFLPYVKRW